MHQGKPCTFPGFMKYVDVQIQHNKQNVYIDSNYMLNRISLLKPFKFIQYVTSLM